MDFKQDMNQEEVDHLIKFFSEAEKSVKVRFTGNGAETNQILLDNQDQQIKLVFTKYSEMNKAK